MKVPFLVVMAFFTLVASASGADAPIKPFHAEYATFRNGSRLGETTLDLRDNGDGSWTLRSETRGTEGLARLAGVHVVEISQLRWRDGRPETLVYDYRQDSAFKRHVRHDDFDWAAGEVRVSDDDQHFRYAIAPGTIDRQTVTIAIAIDLAHDATVFDYKVAVKDRIEDTRYVRGATESLTVPAGTFESVRMQRADAANRRHSAQSWFAKSLGWLPLEIGQTGKKGDTVMLKLVSSNRQ